MTLRLRRIIYLTFILIFLVITPIIILYAAGYRYNFKKHKIQKAGILLLKSEPSGANIFLNNQLQKTATPARISNLLPDDYSIKIEKEGYYPWQKTLPIESQMTTFAENVMLFKKSLPAELIDGDIAALSLSPDKQKLIYLQEKEASKEIWLLDLKNSKTSLLYRLADGKSNLSLEWSYDSRKILITSEKERGLKNYIVLDSQGQEAAVHSNLSDFYLQFKNINSRFVDATQIDNLSFIGSSSRFIVTRDQKTKNLSVLNNDSGDIIFATNANFATWLEPEQKLLYVKDFELWIYEPNSDKEIFITRYSQEIKNAAWLNNNYILFLLDNTLKIIELDERDQRNVVDLLTLEEITDFDVSIETQKIYFTGKIGNKKGVYELQY